MPLSCSIWFGRRDRLCCQVMVSGKVCGEISRLFQHLPRNMFISSYECGAEPMTRSITTSETSASVPERWP